MIRLGFEHPMYLWLLVFLPLLVFFAWTRLAALGRFRQFLAIMIRCVVWTVIVFALAGVQWVRTDDRLTVMYVLDQSESIPASKRKAMLDYVTRNVAKHRNQQRGDRAGIVVFGRDASIEIPPFDDAIPPIRRLESLGTRTDATNLESALNLAQASLSEDTARRIVVVTDGNENLGAANRLARRLTQAGVGIDVVPVRLSGGDEVLVEKIDLPTNIRKGQPFEARVVINRYADAENQKPLKGKLRLTQKVGGEESLVLEQSIELDPDKSVFPIRHQIEQPAAYVYEASFEPDEESGDTLKQNNAATAYTYVRGQGRVLMIVDHRAPDEFDLLIETLLDANIEVVKQPSDNLFGSLAELQAYDAVILAGVPRVSEGNADGLTSMSDLQIEMLVRNTQQLGAGLMMIGGKESFGAGGWTGTKIEEAMPVDFKIKNDKVQAVGALAIIMHASEMAQGNYWQKVIGKAAVEQLGPSDYAGVLHWTMNGDVWMWGGNGGMLPVGPNKRAMLAALNRMTAGDMPQFDPAMKMAVAGLTRLGNKASVKHCIIISDGDPTAPSNATVRAFKNGNITISTVAVASHGMIENQRLQQIATATGGKYYSVKDGRALPRIFQREARRVSKPLVMEFENGERPEVVFAHPVLDGIDRRLPPIGGLVLTQTKNSSLPQVLIRSPRPEAPENSTVLAVWNYGLGRTAALTTDTGARWASSWTQWSEYDRFFAQLVRWLMRPTGDTGKYSIATNVRDGEVQVVVNALDNEDSFLNFLDMNATVLGPDLKPIELKMSQSAPGRYVGSFPGGQSGNYFVNVIPGPGAAPLSTGVTVPYSEEYRVRESNEALMQALVALKPRDGQAGQLMPELNERVADDLIEFDTFRDGVAPARSIRDAWHWFVLAGCGLFLADVFVRRVAIPIAPMLAALNRMRTGKPADVKQTARLDSLKRAKQQAAEQTASRRAAVRFERTSAESDEAVEIVGGNADGGKSAATAKPDAKTDTADGKSYTERLLEAKRRAGK
ncbi:MAG: VWA domain-containing protein [Planctomycetota bacterium]